MVWKYCVSVERPVSKLSHYCWSSHHMYQHCSGWQTKWGEAREARGHLEILIETDGVSQDIHTVLHSLHSCAGRQARSECPHWWPLGGAVWTDWWWRCPHSVLTGAPARQCESGGAPDYDRWLMLLVSDSIQGDGGTGRTNCQHKTSCCCSPQNWGENLCSEVTWTKHGKIFWEIFVTKKIFFYFSGKT